tara:strand:- start:97 stop:1068 length:972 start_codon:yes stop_codon:yes gene_type:complete
MNKPKVSVVMITYGHEKYIEQAINGVLMQKCSFCIELIIANDCSLDNTDDIVNRIIEFHPNADRIRYIKHEKNIGVSRNFFFAIKESRAEYITLCEGDDYWIDPLKIQKQVEFLEGNDEYGLVCTDFNIYNQTSDEMQESIFKNQPNKFPIYDNFEEFLIEAGYMAPCTWMCKKEFFPEEFDGYVDVTFAWLLDIFANSKVGVIMETTTVYRVLEESASHSKSISKIYERAFGLLRIQLDYIDKYKLSTKIKFTVLQKYYNMLLPTLVVLNDSEEIEKAKIYLPKNKRTIKQNILFFLDFVPFGNSLLLFTFKLKQHFNFKIN